MPNTTNETYRYNLHSPQPGNKQLKSPIREPKTNGKEKAHKNLADAHKTKNADRNLLMDRVEDGRERNQPM